MLQLARGISHNEKGCSLALRLPEFLESVCIERHWSKAFHSRVARPSYHGVAAASEDRHPKLPIIVNSKPIAIRASHCIKTVHACRWNTSHRACPRTISCTSTGETCEQKRAGRKPLFLRLSQLTRSSGVDRRVALPVVIYSWRTNARN